MSELNLSTETLQIKNTTMSVFDEAGIYINCKRVFYAYFNELPNILTLKNIQYEKAIDWIEQEFKSSILKSHYRLSDRSKNKMVNIIYVFKNELVVDIENDSVVTILFSKNTESKANDIATGIKKLRRRENNYKTVHLIAESRYGLELLPIKSKKPSLDINQNYNDDFPAVHKRIMSSLKENDKSGLVLLHGIPGTGKSTYIRYLIHALKKTVIFLPPKIAANMDSPSMTSLLIDNRNSIFIIEDAEELIASREGKGDSCISMLLNLTDGMLGESLGIQVICTFNTSLKNIDKALLRKGRLIASYEFKELDQNKASNLLTNLGIKSCNLNQAVALSEIYNMDASHCFETSKRVIGFLTHNSSN